jgi:hypothetical protein
MRAAVCVLALGTLVFVAALATGVTVGVLVGKGMSR